MAGKAPGKNAGASERKIRVAVIGDLILDEYLDGRVIRISPEAPVPVHHVKAQFYKAGGAANTALNIRCAGGEPVLFGVWGDDEGALRLKGVLEEAGVDDGCIVSDPARPTVRKCRVYSENQQLLRIDWELVRELPAEACAKILARLEGTEFDAMLLSDYRKGMLAGPLARDAIAVARAKGVPVIVDPKGHDYTHFNGSTVITPNYKEACEALGLDPLENLPGEELGRRLLEKYDVAHALVTMGARGMVLVSRGTPGSIHKPARAREVFDVTGAGDTVAALIALGLAAGGGFEHVMDLANVAAGVVVEKKGVHAITLSELKAALDAAEPAGLTGSNNSLPVAGDKIKFLEAAAALAAEARAEGRRVAFTNGCFDILHAGHVTYLQQARAAADLLIVGVNEDMSIRRLKGPGRPINHVADRMTVLASLACIDCLVPFGEDTPLTVINAVRPDILVKGADWQAEQIVGAREVQSWGGEVLRIPLVEGRSTTGIIGKIKDREQT